MATELRQLSTKNNGSVIVNAIGLDGDESLFWIHFLTSSSPCAEEHGGYSWICLAPQIQRFMVLQAGERSIYWTCTEIIQLKVWCPKSYEGLSLGPNVCFFFFRALETLWHVQISSGWWSIWTTKRWRCWRSSMLWSSQKTGWPGQLLGHGTAPTWEDNNEGGKYSKNTCIYIYIICIYIYAYIYIMYG